MNYYNIILLTSITIGFWILTDEICITGSKFMAISGAILLILGIIGLYIKELLEIKGK